MPLISHHARASPESPAIECGSTTLTYADLHRIVDDWALHLSRVPSPSIGLCIKNPLEASVLLLAGLRAGRIMFPLSVGLPDQVLLALAVQANLGVIVTRRDLGTICVSPDMLSQTGSGSGTNGRNPSLIVATSGSTGNAKAALLSARSLEVNAAGAIERLEMNSDSRYLLSLPLHHVGGISILWRTIMSGGAIVFASFKQQLHSVLERKNITHVSLVDTQLRRLLRTTERAAPESLRAVLVGGGAVSVSMLRDAYLRGYPVRTTYGLTEMASQVTALADIDGPEMLSTAGTLLPDRELRIRDRNEILVRGKTLFRGYLDDGVCAPPVDANGWFHTGDAGTLDREGYLTVTGRLDNMFISGGENIWPEEIERVLMERFGFCQAVVVPVSDPEFGFRPAAFVAPPMDQSAALPRKEALEEWLPRYKVPRLIPWDGVKGALKVNRQVLTNRAAVELADTR